MTKKIVGLCTAPAGMRAVFAYDGFDDDESIAELPDDRLFYLMPVIALAHRRELPSYCESLDQAFIDGEDQVDPVIISEGAYLTVDNDSIALLGPGEEIEPWIRSEVIGHIESDRRHKKQTREIVARATADARAGAPNYNDIPNGRHDLYRDVFNREFKRIAATS